MAGYVGNSMSVNAAEAYAEGKKPLTRITKDDILRHGVDESMAFFRWFVKKYCTPCEWHHTSAKYNATYFYDIKNCCEMLNAFKKMNFEKLKSEYKERPKPKPDPCIDDKPYYAKIEYSISTFKGSRKYFDEYAVIYKNWAYFGDGGCTKKNITGKHFAIVEKYQSRPEGISERMADFMEAINNKKQKEPSDV